MHAETCFSHRLEGCSESLKCATALAPQHPMFWAELKGPLSKLPAPNLKISRETQHLTKLLGSPGSSQIEDLGPGPGPLSPIRLTLLLVSSLGLAFAALGWEGPANALGFSPRPPPACPANSSLRQLLSWCPSRTCD